MIDLNQVFSPVLRHIYDIDKFGKRDGGGPSKLDQEFSLAYYHLRIPYYFACTQVVANKILSKGLKRADPLTWVATVSKKYLSDTRVIEIVKEVLKKELGDDVEISSKNEEQSYCFQICLKKETQLKPRERTTEEKRNNLDGKLLLSVAEGNIPKIERYITKGANVNMRDPFHRTPIFAIHKNANIIDLLVKHGASVNVVDIAYKSPLDGAQIFKSTSFLNTLYEHCAFKGDKIKSKTQPEIRKMVTEELRKRKESEQRVHQTSVRVLNHLSQQGVSGHIVTKEETTAYKELKELYDTSYSQLIEAGLTKEHALQYLEMLKKLNSHDV